jgi:ribosome-associated protein
VTNPSDRPDTLDATALARLAATAADAKSGTDIVIIDVGPVLAITDYFVIVSGRNDRQVRTIVDEVEHQIKLAGGTAPVRIEGKSSGRWVLMDYGDVIVHVFLDEARAFYDLERLWRDMARVEVAVNE